MSLPSSPSLPAGSGDSTALSIVLSAPGVVRAQQGEPRLVAEALRAVPLDDVFQGGSFGPARLVSAEDGQVRWVSATALEAGGKRWVLVRAVSERAFSGAAGEPAGGGPGAAEGAALQRSQALYAALIAGTTDAVYAKDLEGRYTMINAAGARIFGRPTSEILGRTDFELFPPEEAASTQVNDRAALLWEDTVTYEEVAPGGRVWLSTKGPLRSPEGTVVGLVGSSRDITERKRMEDAARKSEHRLRLALEAAVMGTWEWDVEANSFELSERASALLLLEPRADGRYASTEVARFVPPDDRQVLRERLRGPGASERLVDIEVRVVVPGAAERWLSAHGSLGRDARGRVMGLGVVRDITERKTQQLALQTQEAQLRAALEAGRLATVTWNVRTGETVWGGELERLLGTEAASSARTPSALLARVHPEDREALAREIRDSLAHEDARQLELRVVGDDGRTRWVRAQGRVVRQGSSDPVLAAVFSDVSEHRLLEQFQQRLVAVVGHDLRTPLSVIATCISALELRAQLPPEHQELLRRSGRSARRMERIIQDLLDYTRATVGTGIALKLETVDFADVLRQTLPDLLERYADRTLRATSAGNGRGTWDPVRLGQILENLVSNALKYGDPESPIALHWEGEPDRLVLSVHNGGAPIPAQLVPALFEPFRRADPHDALAPRSLGLGLYIVRQLVLAHRGEIAFSSTAEEGTTFTITLPRTPPPRPATAGPGTGGSTSPSDPS